MVQLKDTYVYRNFKLDAAEITSMTGSAANTDYAVDLTDCDGDVLLIFDMLDSTSSITMDLEVGDYPTRKKTNTFHIPSSNIIYMNLSSGEVKQSDGMAHFHVNGLLESCVMRLIVLKKRMVTNH